jgi:hypothetical protein
MGSTPTILSRPDGTVDRVNLARLNSLPYWLLSNVPNNAVAMVANQPSNPTIMSISGEGPAQVYSLACKRTAPCLVLLQIEDGQSITALMNRSIHVDALFGNFNANNRPYPLPEALFMDETRAIVLTATDISGADNSITPNMLVQRMLNRIADPNLALARARMDKKQYMSKPFFYALDNGSSVLTPGGTNIETITIAGDAHFDLFQISAVSTGVFDMQVINIATGESLIDAPQGGTQAISSNLLTGNAGFPFKFHEPRFFEINSKLQVTLTDRSGGGNTVFLNFAGRALADRMWS